MDFAAYVNSRPWAAKSKRVRILILRRLHRMFGDRMLDVSAVRSYLQRDLRSTTASSYWTSYRGWMAHEHPEIDTGQRVSAGPRLVCRRALSSAEWDAFIDASMHDPAKGLPGWARRTIYLFAASTGLRACEIRRIKPKDLHMERAAAIDRGVVFVRASKLGMDCELLVSTEMARDIKYLMDFYGRVPIPKAPSRMVRRDLERAGIEYIDDRGRRFDFHALRVQAAVRCVDAQAAQELLRHGGPRATTVYRRGVI